MISTDDEQKFRPYAIIEFDAKCSNRLRSWLNDKLRTSKEKNGAQLMTLFSKNSKNEVKKQQQQQ